MSRKANCHTYICITFLKIYSFLFMCIYVCCPEYVCIVCVPLPMETWRGVRPTRTGVPGGCELPSDRNQTRVLCKNIHALKPWAKSLAPNTDRNNSWEWEFIFALICSPSVHYGMQIMATGKASARGTKVWDFVTGQQRTWRMVLQSCTYNYHLPGRSHTSCHQVFKDKSPGLTTQTQ